MNNTEQLRQLMTLDANMNTYDIEERFEKIAKMLFESFAIQKGETVYLFKEIEFYFYNKNHRDIITHPRVSKPLCWYINDFGGIDINFTSSIECVNRENSKGKNVMKYVLDDSAYPERCGISADDISQGTGNACCRHVQIQSGGNCQESNNG